MNPVSDESSFRQQLDAVAERFGRPEAEERRERSKNALQRIKDGLDITLSDLDEPERIQRRLMPLSQAVQNLVSPDETATKKVDASHVVAEAILKQNSLASLNVLLCFLASSRAVAYVHVTSRRRKGTGFLISLHCS
jgi:hypothetical protein